MILLTGLRPEEDNDPCESATRSYVLVYISIALVATAIAIFLVAVVIIEIYVRINAKRKREAHATIIIDGTEFNSPRAPFVAFA